MLLLLHGCQQYGLDFATASGVTAAADRHGFLVVVPRQERRHQVQGCWRWYESGHQRRDAGEPAILAGLVAELAATSEVDARRVYAAGLSAGGAMALILAATYPDRIAAAGVHSATAYRSATVGMAAFRAMAARGRESAPDFDGTIAPVVIVQGTADPVVRAPNADRIVEQWLAARRAGSGRGLSRMRPLASTTVLRDGNRRCTRTRWYTMTRRRVLEYWRVDGLGHAWSGGVTDGAYIDRSGPVAAELMWDFLSRHRLPGGAADRRPQNTEQTPAISGLILDDHGQPMPVW